MATGIIVLQPDREVPAALAAGDPVLRGIGAEIVRHQERAERFGRSVADGWLDLVASTA